MNIILFDFEVFKQDTLLGALLLNNESYDTYQTWNLDEMRQFYQERKNDIWIGHNNGGYDNFILQSIVRGSDERMVKMTSDSIIHGNRRKYLDIQLYYYDLIMNHMCALKSVEAFMGKNISETSVDFNLDRKLTDEEKRLTESYNRDDLQQTLEDFFQLKGEFTLRLDIIKEFNLPMKCLSMTGTQVAETVLHAKKIDDIENWVKMPSLWPKLQVKNQAVIDFYMNRDYAKKTNNTLSFTICGAPHKMAAGGIHGAQKKIHWDWAYYFDVSGYYNLIMILLDLLPRSIPTEYRKVYENMYHEQLRLKKINPQKRGVYKTILLSVFGAMNNKYCKFYDPWNGDLVRLSGQLFLVDLLEKLDGKVEVAQSNTDGIIARPLQGTTEQELIDIINEWQTRTGFVLKLEKIYELHQRDVNCYMYKDAVGEIHTLGEAVKDYGKWQYPFWKDSFKSKEPMIISTALVEYYMFGKSPEQVIDEHRRELRMFQYVCKKLSFDWLEYESTNLLSGETTITRLQNINRAFALNDLSSVGMVYKRKADGQKAKVSNLPDSVFVYDEEILSEKTIDKLIERIDYRYYVDRAYERIQEFANISWIKDIAI